jgi:acyl carrier protein
VDPNDHNKLAPVGAVGEILAETPGVACEYLNDSDRSATTFVSEPTWFKDFTLIGKGKFLKTGDLARYHDDGSIIHLGRKDSEVKIRGQRVDLRDIEHRLLEHLGDEADVFVELVNPRKSSPVMAAFLWFRDRQQTADTVDIEVQGFVMADDSLKSKLQTVDLSLRNILPSYMVLSVYLSLADLPTTTTNKVDRRQLRERAAKLTRSEMEMLMHGQQQCVGITTNTPLEEQVVRLIAENLQLERSEIGSNANFIRLGGDSLAAMKLSNRCRELGIVLTVQDILQETNIASLMSRASSQQQIVENSDTISSIRKVDVTESPVTIAQTVIQLSDSTETASIAPEAIEYIYPCSPIQRGMLLSQVVDPRRHKIRLSFKLSLASQAEQIGLGRLQEAWMQVNQRHPALRTVFILNGSVDRQPAQIVLKAGEEASLSGLFEDSAEPNKERNDIRSYFPRSHLSIELLSTQEVLCRLDTNHVAIDGLSIGILLRDFLLAYDKQLNSRLVINIGDYLKVLTEAPQQPALKYWTAALKNREPTIFPKMSNVTYDEGTAQYHIIDIEIGLSSTFSDFAHKYGVTLSNIINVAWALVLQSFTGQQSVCFGYMVSGRDLPVKEIWDTVGLFTNMIVSLVDIDPSMSLLQILKETQNSFIQTLPFQHVAATDVFDALGVSMHTLFNSMVSVTNIGTKVPPEAASLKLQMVELLDFSEYEISVELRAEEGRLVAWIKYWDSAFTHGQVQNIASVFKKAIHLLLTNPHQSANSLYLLSDQDEEQIKGWTQQLPQQVDDCIHQQIQERCRLQPTAKAVESWDQSLTYYDLSRLSSLLALHLAQNHGVGPGKNVPVCLDKSSWTPVAMI